jgi:cyclic pyranopterin phosphate synthase
VRRIGAELPLAPVAANYTGETAARWRYATAAAKSA